MPPSSLLYVDWSSFDPVKSIGVGQECQGEPNLGVWSLNWGDMETLLAPPIVNTYVPGGRGCKSMSIACSITTSNSALSQAGWHPLILMGTRTMVSNLPLLIYKELYCKKIRAVIWFSDHNCWFRQWSQARFPPKVLTEVRAKETCVDLMINTLQSGVWSSPCQYLVSLVIVGVPLTFRRCCGVVSTTAGGPVLWYWNVLGCCVGQNIWVVMMMTARGPLPGELSLHWSQVSWSLLRTQLRLTRDNLRPIRDTYSPELTNQRSEFFYSSEVGCSPTTS